MLVSTSINKRGKSTRALQLFHGRSLSAGDFGHHQVSALQFQLPVQQLEMFKEEEHHIVPKVCLFSLSCENLTPLPY